MILVNEKLSSAQMIRYNFLNGGFEIFSEMPQTHKEVEMADGGVWDRKPNKPMTNKEKEACWEGMT